MLVDSKAPNSDLKEKENPGQEVVAMRETKDANDNSRVEIEGKHTGLSLTSALVESYAKFDRRVMLKIERARGQGSLVWVRKGESSQAGVVTMENAEEAIRRSSAVEQEDVAYLRL